MAIMSMDNGSIIDQYFTSDRHGDETNYISRYLALNYRLSAGKQCSIYFILVTREARNTLRPRGAWRYLFHTLTRVRKRKTFFRHHTPR